jgi:predicted  nucleic acid-binding Zn-ribbon protein
MTVDRARRVVGVALVAVAVAIGGCGGGSDGDKTGEYKEDAKAIIGPLRGKLNSTNERVGAATNLNQRLAALEETRKALDTAASKMKELDPPDDATPEHDKFIAALERFAADIRAFETASRDNDRSGIKESLSALRTDTAQLKQANDALKAKVDG